MLFFIFLYSLLWSGCIQMSLQSREYILRLLTVFLPLKISSKKISDMFRFFCAKKTLLGSFWMAWTDIILSWSFSYLVQPPLSDTEKIDYLYCTVIAIRSSSFKRNMFLILSAEYVQGKSLLFGKIGLQFFMVKIFSLMSNDFEKSVLFHESM